MTVRKTFLSLVFTLVVGALSIGMAGSTRAQGETLLPDDTAAQAAAGISALGSVEANVVVPLYFQANGTVKGVYAKPGDYVQAGDVLAELDATSQWNAYNQAQLNLENAQISLDTLKQPPSANDLKVAQANVTSAQAAYGNTANSVSSDKLKADQLKYQQAQDQLAALQQARANMGGSDDQIALQDAKIGAQTFNNEIQRLQLEAEQTPNSSALWQASIRITQAQLSLDQLTAGPTQAQLDNAQIAIDRAEASLLDAQAAIVRTQLIAPQAGTVTAVNIAVGDSASGQTAAIEISDMSQLRMTVPVNELDVEKVQPGAKATIQLDALPGVDIPGSVEYVGWLSTTSSDGIVTYDVRIDLNTTDPRVRLGMTGEVNIDTGSSSS